MNSAEGGIYLGLGTNLGERTKNISNALEALNGLRGIRVLRHSPLYRSRPWGVKHQPWFLNSVCEISANCDPLNLLRELKILEKKIGRKSGKRWGPRLIDMDILLWRNVIIKSDILSIPHSHITERIFVLMPLLELAPGLCHPESGTQIKIYLENLQEKETDNACTLYNPNV